MKNLKSHVLSFVLLTSCLSATAQKLSKIQQTGIWAPENIKVDGKLTEWQNRFEAYNKKEQLYYTIANDDKNLYLVIHTREHNTINKVYVGGITFAISTAMPPKSKKNDVNKVSITYPIIGRINNGIYLHAYGDYKKLKRDSIANQKNMISFIGSQNKMFNDTYKEIKIKGIKDIDEPVISLYNTEGIKARALFDSNLEYTYELAIPLKYLKTAFNGLDKFKYNIKLNGRDREGVDPYPQTRFTGNATIDMNKLYIQTATDFSGECTLAVK